MKNSPAGDAVPHVTISWPIATQNIAAANGITLGPVACNGARAPSATQTNPSHCQASPRVVPPVNATGAGPTFTAYCPADDTVAVLVSNPSAAVLVATAADIVVDVFAFPTSP